MPWGVALGAVPLGQRGAAARCPAAGRRCGLPAPRWLRSACTARSHLRSPPHPIRCWRARTSCWPRCCCATAWRWRRCRCSWTDCSTRWQPSSSLCPPSCCLERSSHRPCASATGCRCVSEGGAGGGRGGAGWRWGVLPRWRLPFNVALPAALLSCPALPCPRWGRTWPGLCASSCCSPRPSPGPSVRCAGGGSRPFAPAPPHSPASLACRRQAAGLDTGRGERAVQAARAQGARVHPRRA